MKKYRLDELAEMVENHYGIKESERFEGDTEFYLAADLERWREFARAVIEEERTSVDEGASAKLAEQAQKLLAEG